MQGHSFKVLPLAPRSADFDPRPIDPVELPGIMRRHIYTGAMAGVYGTFTNGIFLIAFGNALGVTVLQWGVHGAITCFALALQIISAHFGACHGRRKLLWWAAESTARLLKTVALVSALAFYAYGYPGAAAMSLITWLCISSMFSAVAAPVWYSWLVDIIPERVHGRFMGRRDLWISLLTVAAVIPAGWAIDAFGDELKTTVLAAIFLAGVVLGILDVSLHRVIPEPPTDRDSGTSLWARLRVPLHDPEFRPWLTFVGVWNFAMFLGGALSGIYFIENLGLRDNFLGGAVVLIVVPLLAVVFTSKWLGALVDSIGVKRMLVLSHFCWALLPAFWVLATPQTAIFWLGLSSIIGGAAGSPAVNAANKLVSRTPPPPLRAMYLAVSTCIANVGGGLGALTGGWFLKALDGSHWVIGGWELVPFQMLFLASFVLRMASWGLVFRVKSPEFDRAVLGALAAQEPIPAVTPMPAPVILAEATPERAA